MQRENLATVQVLNLSCNYLLIVAQQPNPDRYKDIHCYEYWATHMLMLHAILFSYTHRSSSEKLLMLHCMQTKQSMQYECPKRAQCSDAVCSSWSSHIICITQTQQYYY